MLTLALLPQKDVKLIKKKLFYTDRRNSSLGKCNKPELGLNSVVSKYKAKNCQNYNEKSVQLLSSLVIVTSTL